MSIIASIIAVSATAISNRYLWGRPLPCFSGSYSLALGNDWGLASKGTSLANLIDSYSLTKSYRSSR
jgi:hypothetical protein